MDDTVVIIPAYQPTDELTELANSLYSMGFRIVIVDDGSGEEYSKIFDKVEAYATVIGYEKNMGKGYALRYGIDFIVKEKPYFKYLITVDSDGQHTEDAVRTISAKIHKQGGIVIGQRDTKKCNLTKFESVSCACIRTFYALLTGMYIRDIQSGLRAFEFSYLEHLTYIKGDGFDYETNVLTDAAKRRVPISTVKISTCEIQTTAKARSHYNMSDFYAQFLALLRVGYPSLLAQLANILCILIIAGVTGAHLTGTVGAVLLGGYIGTALSVFLNNKIGYEDNADGILSYNRILMGILRMFAYVLFMVIFHNMLGIGLILSLILTMCATALVEVKVMSSGLDSDLRVLARE